MCSAQPIFIIDQDQASWCTVTPSPEHQIQVTGTGAFGEAGNEQPIETARPDGRPSGTCRDIRVADCVIESRSCALKIGTETHGNIEDVVFEDCRIENSNRGLGVFSRDGGRISNVRFSRITLECCETPDGFWGSGEALTVTLVDRRTPGQAGAIQGLTVEDVTGTMEGAINLISPEPGRVSEVRLNRIALAQRPGRFGTALQYDLRRGPADLSPSPDAAGRSNAGVKNSSGKIIGLLPYPNGMPGLYAYNIEALDIDAVNIGRALPLPAGWNPQVIILACPD